MSKRPKKKGSDLTAFTAAIEKQYGVGAAKTGRWKYSLNAIPTGSLALDYELGTGGWPRGHLVGVFGKRDIGKSSMVGLSAVREAQKLGLNVAWIALEPSFDVAWAEKHGVNMEQLMVLWPRTGEEAFEMLWKVVDNAPDLGIGLVMFDSIGAVQSESEIVGTGTKEAVAKVGGASRLISWGANRIAPIAYRNNVCLIFLNQIRDDMKARMPGQVRQPGGNAIEHLESMIVQLKPGKERYMHEEVEIGRQVIAHVLRNKLNEGSGQKAIFDFYAKDTGGRYPFGIDLIEDVIATGKRTGTIRQRGAYYDLPDNSSHQGRTALAVYLEDTPAAYEACREAILEVMVNGNSTATVLNTDEPTEGDDADDATAE